MSPEQIDDGDAVGAAPILEDFEAPPQAALPEQLQGSTALRPDVEAAPPGKRTTFIVAAAVGLGLLLAAGVGVWWWRSRADGDPAPGKPSAVSRGLRTGGANAADLQPPGKPTPKATQDAGVAMATATATAKGAAVVVDAAAGPAVPAVDGGPASDARVVVSSGTSAPDASVGEPSTGMEPDHKLSRKERRREYIKKGRQLIRRGRQREARAVLTKALNIWDSASLRQLFAKSHERAGEVWPAIHHLKKALAKSPRSAYTLTRLGKLYLRAGKRSLACAQLRKALRVKAGYRTAQKALKRSCGGR